MGSGHRYSTGGRGESHCWWRRRPAIGEREGTTAGRVRLSPGVSAGAGEEGLTEGEAGVGMLCCEVTSGGLCAGRTVVVGDVPMSVTHSKNNIF